jgi:hypothetical protein
VMERLFKRADTVFALVFVWKVALFLLSAQPVPMSDAFFYDGPVVNFLLNGAYVNPSLARVMPISSSEVFSAYPPIYQAALLPWMFLFGPSAFSAIAFHLLLFGLYLLALMAIFRRLNLPVWVCSVAAAFLPVLTFHDRPDSLAYVFGLGALYAWIRSRGNEASEPGGKSSSTPYAAGSARPGWTWVLAGLAVLGVCTSLQIGAFFSLLLWFLALGTVFLTKAKFAYGPMLALVAVPVALATLVGFGFPHLWAGFVEHTRVTPALANGWRLSSADILRLLRTSPGVLVGGLLLPWMLTTLYRSTRNGNRVAAPALWALTVASTLFAVGFIAAALLSPKSGVILAPAYLQPLVVAGTLAVAPAFFPDRKRLRFLAALFLAVAAIGWIRPIGMSTWGLACAADVGYPAAIRYVRHEFNTCPRGSTVVVSAAFLYEAARYKLLRWIHCDWMMKHRWERPDADWEALIAIKPAKLVLTQFDYYRRFKPVLAQFQTRPDLVEVHTVDTARFRPPDAVDSMQRVVQHISWAPVIVDFNWK